MGSNREQSELEGRIRRHMAPLASSYGQLEREGRVWHRRVETAPVPVVTTSESGTVTWANRAAGKLFNMPAELLTRRPLAAFVQTDEQAAFDALRVGALAATTPLSGRHFSVTPRRRKPVAVLAAVAAGRLDVEAPGVELCWSLTDVSELKRSERALRRTIARLERVVDEQAGKLDVAAGRVADALAEAQHARQNVGQTQAMLDLVVGVSDDAVFTVDSEGMVGSWNRGAAKLFGREPAAVVGRPVTSVLQDATVDVLTAAAEACAAGARWLPTVARRHDGSTWQAAWSVRDASVPGRPLFVCAVRRDRGAS